MILISRLIQRHLPRLVDFSRHDEGDNSQLQDEANSTSDNHQVEEKH